MSTHERTAVVPDEVFLRHDNAASKGAWFIAGGIFALAVASLGFVFALLVRVNEFSLHALTTLPVLMGIGALASGIGMLRTAWQVSVGPAGITMTDRRGRHRLAWPEIGWATVAPLLMGNGKQLVVYDPQGKAIARFSQAFDNFDRLVDLVTYYVAQRGDATAERIQRKKGLKSAVLTAFTGICLIGAAVGVALFTRSDQRAEQLLATEGKPGTGKVVELFVAPNGRTTRVRYQVELDGQLGPLENVEVTRDYWKSLANETTVPVLYVPSDPSVSRLVEGQVPDDSPSKNPLMGYGIAALGGLLGLGLLGISAMQFAGWDIDLDSKTGKVSIKRFGTGR